MHNLLIETKILAHLTLLRDELSPKVEYCAFVEGTSLGILHGDLQISINVFFEFGYHRISREFREQIRIDLFRFKPKPERYTIEFDSRRVEKILDFLNGGEVKHW